MMLQRRLNRALPFVLAAILLAAAGAVETALAQGAWLDTSPPVNWNQPGAALPPAAQTLAVDPQCLDTTRPPAGPAEEAVAQAGWKLYGEAHTLEPTVIVTALADFDGMCRPLLYQAFVFAGGRFAGTLAPTAMNSREDGSLFEIHLDSATSLSADFARYADADPLCCPSRTQRVVYELVPGDRSMITPVEVVQLMQEQAGAATATDAGGLFGRPWTLSEMGDRGISGSDLPTISFDLVQMTASGFTGCNNFTGGYSVDGATLSFSPLATTRRACLGAEQQVLESDFLRLLATTTQFGLEDDVLRLFAGDTLVLSFVAR